MDEPRFVLDTNMIVSGLMSAVSAPGQALDKAIGVGRPLLSGPVVIELVDILGRARLDRYVSREKRARFLMTLPRKAVFPSITASFQVCRDPKDDKFLDLAVVGAATCLITGDADLLVLDPFHGIPIVTPRRFLDEFHFDEDEPADADGEAAEDSP
jgi:putative PIN family toxin of toxin-antitoxin system